ncbi:MAG: hypothetical protein AAFQ12_04200 [Pseudomonadota bacterium]
MNPYSRFGLVSNTVSAAAILGLLAVTGPQFLTSIETIFGQDTASTALAVGGAVAIMVVFWLAMTEAILPSLFRFNTVRRLILGKYYFEGTWLQSEKGDGHQRLSVIDIQPDGKGFIFSGYSLNKDLEIESNTLIEFSDMSWPFMTYKHRNSLSDGADGRRDGVGELQFEMNRSASRRYNGFVQFVRSPERVRIEGAKLTSGREVKSLRTLQGRQTVFAKYWDLFFNTSLRNANGPITVRPRPVTMATAAKASAERRIVIESADAQEKVGSALDRMEETAARVERRKSDGRDTSDDEIVRRRRASDWVKDPVSSKVDDGNDDEELDLEEDSKTAKAAQK